MQDKPLISIITVNLNDVEGLKRTISSAFEQTWQEFEYIVIDGDSKDGSKEYIESHSDKIDYWVSEEDSGIYNAMNKGIKASNGEYLLFLNSGDELINSTVLERSYKLLHTEDIIYFDIKLIFPDNSWTHKYPEILNIKDLMEGSIGHPTTFIKKVLFDKIGLYDENLKIVSDWKFFIIALFKLNCTSRKINIVLSKFYMDGISTTQKKLVQEERNFVLNKYFVQELRLIELELFVKNIKNSRLIKVFVKLGFLKYVDRMN